MIVTCLVIPCTLSATLRDSYAHPAGYLESTAIRVWDYNESADEITQMARAIVWLCKIPANTTMNDLVFLMQDIDEGIQYPEYRNWIQYLVSVRLNGYEDPKALYKDEQSKEATLKWAKENGYWEEDYVPPFKNWNVDLLKDSYIIEENVADFFHVSQLDGRHVTDKTSDYTIYTFAKNVCGWFNADHCTPSTCKYIVDETLPREKQVTAGCYYLYDGLAYLAEDGEAITDEKMNKEIGFTFLLTEDQFRFVRHMTKDEFLEFQYLCQDTYKHGISDEEYRQNALNPNYYGTKRWANQTGWRYGEDAPEYVLEFLAETKNPGFKGSKYEGWYNEWLKKYDGTAGNPAIISNSAYGYEEWYADWLKKNNPSVTLDSKKGDDGETTPVPTAAPTKTPDVNERADELGKENSTGSHEHEYIPNVTVDPTCTEDGTVEYVCTCGDVVTEVLPLLGHLYAITDSAEPTCTLAGYTTVTCQRDGCGDTYTEYVDALGHAWTEIGRTDKSCTVDGTVTYRCDNCGEERTDVDKAAGHSEEVTDSRQSSCSEEGYVTYVCSECGESRTETVAKLQHTEAERTVTEATFFKKGMTETYCTVCGEVLGTTETDAVSPLPWWAYAATGGAVLIVIAAVVIKKRRY